MSGRTFALILCVASACALSAACGGSASRRRPLAAEAPPPADSTPAAEPAAAAPEPAAAPARALPPPDAAEVGGAVERIFKGAVTFGGDARAPSFAVGDFNGDDSQDLAVALAVAPGRAEEVNDELANWIVKDPFAPAHASYGEARRRVLVGEADALLAVIHGYGPDGWRDPRATQTYVLKDAAGSSMKARERKAVAPTGGGAPLPRLLGDVIDETVGGRAGFLYYNGAHYLWYDPRRYVPPPPARVVHGGAVKAVRQ